MGSSQYIQENAISVRAFLPLNPSWSRRSCAFQLGASSLSSAIHLSVRISKPRLEVNRLRQTLTRKISHQAAATAREALLGLAAVKLGVQVEQLTVADGITRAIWGLTSGPSLSQPARFRPNDPQRSAFSLTRSIRQPLRFRGRTQTTPFQLQHLSRTTVEVIPL
jgi:hypothetical protein